MSEPTLDLTHLPEVPLVDRGHGYKVGTELYLVRHGESMSNTYSNLGAFDPNLTALGWAQVLRVGKWMAEHTPLDVVITSPLRRAHSTALAIAHAQGLPVVEVAGLEEFSHDYWTEIPPHHPTRPWWGRLNWAPQFEQAPNFVAFRDRVQAALVHILERYAGQRIGVISHGGTMGVLVAAMAGSAQLSVWNHNTGISLFVWPEWKRWLVHYINRTEHLLGLDPADYPRVAEAEPTPEGFWRLPDNVVRSHSALKADPALIYLANRLQRSHRILWVRPADPITPLRASIRSRRAVIVHDDLLALEAGEVRRAGINANHIRYEYLFRPFPFPDAYFDYAVVTEPFDDGLAADVARVLKNPAGLIRHAPPTHEAAIDSLLD